MTPRTFAPKAAVTPLGGNDPPPHIRIILQGLKGRTRRTPNAFASEHSNVVAGRVLMDSLANRFQLTVR